MGVYCAECKFFRYYSSGSGISFMACLAKKRTEEIEEPDKRRTIAFYMHPYERNLYNDCHDFQQKNIFDAMKYFFKIDISVHDCIVKEYVFYDNSRHLSLSDTWINADYEARIALRQKTGSA